MKFSTHLISTLLLSIFIIYSCKNKNTGKGHPTIFKTAYLGEAKDYLYFKPGSYWVYKNSVTGQIDTHTQLGIDTSVEFTSNDTRDALYKLQYTNIKFTRYSSLLKNKMYFSMYLPFAANPGVAIKCIYIDSIYPLNYDYLILPIYSEDTSNFIAGVYRCGLHNKINTLITTYDTCYLIKWNNSYYWPQSKKTDQLNGIVANQYFKKGIGIVKIWMQSGFRQEIKESWDLIKYEIIK